VQYVYDVINDEIKNNRHEKEERFKLFCEYYKFKFGYFLYGIYYSLMSWWYSQNNEDADLNVAF